MTTPTTLLTTAEVARELGVTPRRVLQLAAELRRGQRLNARMLVFTPADLAAMRARSTTPGRPNAKKDP